MYDTTCKIDLAQMITRLNEVCLEFFDYFGYRPHKGYIGYAFIGLFSLEEVEMLSLLEELKNIGGKCGIRIEVGATTAIKPDGYVMMAE